MRIEGGNFAAAEQAATEKRIKAERKAERKVKPKARTTRWAVLSPDDVREIRRLCAQRRELLAQVKALDSRALAARFGVHFQTINYIENGRKRKGVV